MASIARPVLSASRPALRQVARRDVARVAAFHNTSKRALLPAGPRTSLVTSSPPCFVFVVDTRLTRIQRSSSTQVNRAPSRPILVVPY